MNKTSKIVIAIIVGALIIWVIIGINNNKEKKMISIPIENSTDIMKEYKNNFMDGCLEEGSYSQCNCYYNSLKNNLGEDGIIDLSINYLKTEQIPAEVLTQIISDCSSEL